MRSSKTELFPVLAILGGGTLAVVVSALLIAAPSFANPPAPVPALWSSGEASTWVVSVDLGRAGSGDVRFELTREGDRIAGTYSGTMGRGLPVEGTVTDGLVELAFDTDEGKVTYEGTLAGTRLAGTTDYGTRGSGTFEGRRRR